MDDAGAAQQQHALAQSMVTGARNPNSRTVRTDPSRRSYGSDGRLYKLIDKRDYGRYKVLTDDELLEESRKVGEMERDITDLSDSLHRRSPGRGRSQTRSPVQVGMAKKSVLQAQVARRKKEQAEMEEQRRQKEEDEEEERRLRALREEKSATRSSLSHSVYSRLSEHHLPLSNLYREMCEGFLEPIPSFFTILLHSVNKFHPTAQIIITFFSFLPLHPNSNATPTHPSLSLQL